MQKDEIKKILLEKLLGNKRGINVYVSPDKLGTTENALITNWNGPIFSPTNAPADKYWFAMIDYDPNANWEHPVDYIIIDDKTGKYNVIKGNSPPNILDKMEKIR